MTPVETFAAYGAPAVILVCGYALVWWTRLSPGLFAKIVSYREHSNLRHINKRT